MIRRFGANAANWKNSARVYNASFEVAILYGIDFIAAMSYIICPTFGWITGTSANKAEFSKCLTPIFSDQILVCIILYNLYYFCDFMFIVHQFRFSTQTPMLWIKSIAKCQNRAKRYFLTFFFLTLVFMNLHSAQSNSRLLVMGRQSHGKTDIFVSGNFTSKLGCLKICKNKYQDAEVNDWFRNLIRQRRRNFCEEIFSFKSLRWEDRTCLLCFAKKKKFLKNLRFISYGQWGMILK